MEHAPGEIIHEATTQVSVDFKKTEIISSIFSNHNAMKLEINYMKKTYTSARRLSSVLLNNQWVTEEIKEEMKKIPGDKWKRKYNDSKSLTHAYMVIYDKGSQNIQWGRQSLQ